MKNTLNFRKTPQKRMKNLPPVEHQIEDQPEVESKSKKASQTYQKRKQRAKGALFIKASQYNKDNKFKVERVKRDGKKDDGEELSQSFVRRKANRSKKMPSVQTPSFKKKPAEKEKVRAQNNEHGNDYMSIGTLVDDEQSQFSENEHSYKEPSVVTLEESSIPPRYTFRRRVKVRNKPKPKNIEVDIPSQIPSS